MWYTVVDPLNCELSMVLIILVVDTVAMEGADEELNTSKISAHKHTKHAVNLHVAFSSYCMLIMTDFIWTVDVTSKLYNYYVIIKTQKH